MPCFVPRLEVTPVLSGCSHTMLQYRPHTTPLTFIKLKQNNVFQKEKKKKVGKSYQRKPAPAGIFLLQLIIPRPCHSFLRRGKLEIPYIQHNEHYIYSQHQHCAVLCITTSFILQVIITCVES